MKGTQTVCHAIKRAPLWRMRTLRAAFSLLIAAAGTGAQADERGEALVARVLHQVAASRPMIADYTTTVRYQNAFETQHQHVYALADDTSGMERSRVASGGELPFTTAYWLFLTLNFLPGAQDVFQAAAANNPSAIPPPRYVGKQTIEGVAYDVVEVNCRIVQIGMAPQSPAIALRWYVGEDNLIRRITARLPLADFGIAPIRAALSSAPANPNSASKTGTKNGAKAGAKNTAQPAVAGASRQENNQASKPEDIRAAAARGEVTVEASAETVRKAILFSPRPFTNPPLPPRIVNPPSGPVQVAALSADGALLATGGEHHAIDVYNAATGERKFTLPGRAEDAHYLQFSPDGRLLAGIVGEAGSLRLWDMTAGDLLRAWSGKGERLTCLAFSPDGKRLVVGGYGTPARVLDTDTGATALTLDQSGAWGVTFSPDGTRLVVIGAGQAVLWDATTGKKWRVLADALHFAPAAAFSPDGKWLVIGRDKTALLYEGHTGEPSRELQGAAGRLAALAFTENGRTLLAVDADARGDIPSLNPGLVMWNTADWRLTEARELSGAKPGGFATVPILAPFARRILLLDPNMGVQMWDLAETLPKVPPSKP